MVPQGGKRDGTPAQQQNADARQRAPAAGGSQGHDAARGDLPGEGPLLADTPRAYASPLAYAVEARDRSSIAMVKEAVAHKQVILAYQPVVLSDRHERVAFYEGLIRVLDETGRIIPARDFIPAIETTETGRIIDCLALEQGLGALRSDPTLRLSINMSARSIGYQRWGQTLRQNLSRHPDLAERLILEITEISVLQVPDLVLNFMSDLRRFGISFALDEFGAELTSFRYLRDFYFDILKIDSSYFHGIHNSPDNQALIGGMLCIARPFDMLTVAVGVENPHDAKWLEDAGVDCMQGYHFAAPSVQPPWLPAQEKQRA